jgi:hypothetical protein
MWYKASGGRGGVGLYRGAQLGNELEEEEDTAYTWARRGSDTERRRRARRPAASTGLAHYATRERGWLRAEREKSCGLGQGGRGEGLRAKTEMKKASTFPFLFQYFKYIFK